MKLQPKLILIVLLYAISSSLPAQNINNTISGTDGAVYASVQRGDTLFIGGSFSYAGFESKGIAHFIKDSSRPDVNFPQINGNISNVISDDAGGYFIGGNNLKYFNGYDLSNNGKDDVILVHVKQDYTLDSNFIIKDDIGQGGVTGLKKVNNKLYVGGTFTNINNTMRPYLAELNAATGLLDNWIPAINTATDIVDKIEATDSVIFVTGGFSRSPNTYVYSEYMRTFSANTGSIIKGFPTLTSEDDIHRCLKINGNNLYVGTAGSNSGYNAFGVGRFDTITGKQFPNLPATNGIIYALASDGSGGYYIGGDFDMVDNIPKSNLAHVLSDGKVDTAFNLVANSDVRCFTSDGVNVYIGGYFTRIGDSTRYYAAAISLASKKIVSWNPGPNGDVLAMTYSNSIIYLGGRFNKIGKIARSRAASVTLTGALTAWNPNLNGDVFCITPNQTGSFLYIGGYYSFVKNKARNNICKVDNNTGILATWNPGVSSAVEAIVVDGANIYFGGYFYYVGAYTRNYLACVDTSKGTPTSFNPNPDNYVSSLAAYGGKLYVGGDFTRISNINQNFAARFDLKTKKLDTWNPYVIDTYPGSYGGNINTIFPANNSVLLGGEFTLGNAITVNHIFNFDTRTGVFGNFSPKIDSMYGDINALEFSGTEVFAGGNLRVLKSDNSWKYGIYSFDTSSGSLKRSFEQFQGGTVTALKVKNNSLYIGGGFTGLSKKDNSGSIIRLNMCSFELNTDTLESATYDLNALVTNLLADSNGIIAAGSFNLAKSLSRQNLAAINLKTGGLTNFNPTAGSGNVTSLALKDSTLYIGGGFDEINEVPRAHLAAVNVNTSQVTNWICNADSYVNKLFLRDSTLYALGYFNNIQSIPRNYIGAISTVDGSVLPWYPNPDYYVYSMACANNKIYLGGAFSNCGGQARRYLAEVDPVTGNASAWNPPFFQNSVNALLADSLHLYASVGLINAGGNRFINELCRFNIANDSIDLNFHPPFDYSSDGWIDQLAKYNDNLFISGGNLYDTHNTPLPNFLRINVNTNLLTSFNPNPNAGIQTINVFDNRLIVGGSWTDMINYSPQSYLGVFSLDSVKSPPVLVFNNIQSSTATAGFYNLGQGNKLLVIRQDSIPILPTNGKEYNSNNIYGLGDSTGAKSYVVYTGTDSLITITGLRPNHTYYVSEVNYSGSGSDIIYANNTALTGNFQTLCNSGSVKIDSSGSLSICADKSVLLWAAQGYKSYLWSNGQTTDTISVSNPNYYYVMATDSNNCYFFSNNVTVTQAPCPSPTGLSVSNVSKSSTQLSWNVMSCAVAYQLQWRRKGTTTWAKTQVSTTGKVLTGLASGTTYQWRVATYCETNPVTIISPYTNGAEFTTAASFAVSISPNYNDESSAIGGNLSAILSPNPAINTATLILNNVKGTAQIFITDINGKVLWEKDHLTNSTISLPVQELSGGIYFVRVQDDANRIILKLIKTN